MDRLSSWRGNDRSPQQSLTRLVGCGVTGPQNGGNHQLSAGIWYRCPGSRRVLDTPVMESPVGGCGRTSPQKWGYWGCGIKALHLGAYFEAAKKAPAAATEICLIPNNEEQSFEITPSKVGHNRKPHYGSGHHEECNIPPVEAGAGTAFPNFPRMKPEGNPEEKKLLPKLRLMV